MIDHADTTRSAVVAAVQQELNRFSKQVSSEVQRLRDDIATERAARARSEETVRTLLPAIENRLAEVLAQAEGRVQETDVRVGRLADETNVGFAAAVESATRPVVEQLEHRQSQLEQDLTSIDRSVRKFDEQSAVMVQHFNTTTEAIEARLDKVNRAIEAMGAGAQFDAVDADGIDEIKDRVASAAGEVELVRIEVERFQRSMGESMDKTVGRIVELETQMQEQHMEVETAVQLERLEEVERALLALDPGQFVRRDEAAPGSAPALSAFTPLTPPTPFQPQATGQF